MPRWRMAAGRAAALPRHATRRRRARSRCSARSPPGTSTTSWPRRRRRPACCRPRSRRGRQLAFKTGTSYGYRDAWAVGYDRDVTIAVWAGRPDGTPMPGRSGRLTAAPVLFKIADLLPRLRRRRSRGGAAARRRADRRPARSAAGLAASRRRTARRRTQGRSRRPADPLSAGRVGRCLGRAGAAARSGRRQRAITLAGRRPAAAAGATPRRTLFWRPGGPGFVRLTVIDGDGRSARATVRLVP